MNQPMYVIIRVRAPWLLYGPALLCALRLITPATYIRLQQWLLGCLVRAEAC